MSRYVVLFEVTGKDIPCSECRAVCASVVVVSYVVGFAVVSTLCCSYVWYWRLWCADMCSVESTVIGGLSGGFCLVKACLSWSWL